MSLAVVVGGGVCVIVDVFIFVFTLCLPPPVLFLATGTFF